MNCISKVLVGRKLIGLVKKKLIFAFDNQVAKQTDYPLTECGLCLLEPYISGLWIDFPTLHQFLFELELMYQPNPYHNSLHGATVAHMTASLVNYLDIFTG